MINYIAISTLRLDFGKSPITRCFVVQTNDGIVEATKLAQAEIYDQLSVDYNERQIECIKLEVRRTEVVIGLVKTQE